MKTILAQLFGPGDTRARFEGLLHRTKHGQGSAEEDMVTVVRMEQAINATIAGRVHFHGVSEALTVKMFEVRDRMTTMSVLAVSLLSDVNPAEKFLLGRAGFYGSRCILLIDLGGNRCSSDPFGWATSARTIPRAHLHIIEHWDDLTSGDVIDVEFINGESSAPKTSERQD